MVDVRDAILVNINFDKETANPIFTTEGKEIKLVFSPDQYQTRQDRDYSIEDFQLDPANKRKLQILQPLLVSSEGAFSEGAYSVFSGNTRLKMMQDICQLNAKSKSGQIYEFEPLTLEFLTKEEEADPIALLKIAASYNKVKPLSSADLILAIRNFYDAYIAEKKVSEAEIKNLIGDFFQIHPSEIPFYLDAAGYTIKYSFLFDSLKAGEVTPKIITYIIKSFRDLELKNPDQPLSLQVLFHEMQNRAIINASEKIGSNLKAKTPSVSITQTIVDEILQNWDNSGLFGQDDDSESENRSTQGTKETNQLEKQLKINAKKLVDDIKNSEGLIVEKLTQQREPLLSMLEQMTEFVPEELRQEFLESVSSMAERFATIGEYDRKGLKTLLQELLFIKAKAEATFTGFSQYIVKTAVATEKIRTKQQESELRAQKKQEKQHPAKVA